MTGAAKDDPDSRQAKALLDAIDRASEPAMREAERAADSSGRSTARYASTAPHAPPVARSGPLVPEPAVIVEAAPPAPWSSPRGAVHGLPPPPVDGQTVLLDRAKLARLPVARASSREKLLAFVTMVFVVSACGIGLLLVGSRRARKHVVVPAPVVAAPVDVARGVEVASAPPERPSAAPPTVAAESPTTPERSSAVTTSGLLGASTPEPTPAAPVPARRARPAQPSTATPPPAPAPAGDGELKSHFER